MKIPKSNFSVEKRLKEIREERAFDNPLKYPHCVQCGLELIHVPEEDEWTRLCFACLIRVMGYAIHYEDNETVFERKVCNRCFKKRKLIGAWCRKCRNAYQATLKEDEHGGL